MKKDLYSSLEYPDFTVTSAKYTEQKSENPVGNLKFEVTIKGFGDSKGQRIYFTPAFTKEDYLPADTSALRVTASYINVDSISYYIPIGYKVESMPEDVFIESEFGTYRYSLKTNADQIVLYRQLELNEGLIPFEKYNSFRKFYNSTATADRGIIILNRQAN
jgi:hypothetical protein